MGSSRTGNLAVGLVVFAACTGCPSKSPIASKPPAPSSERPAPPPPPSPSTPSQVSSGSQAAPVSSGAVGWDKSAFAHVRVGQVYKVRIGSHVIAGGKIYSNREITHVTDKYIAASDTVVAAGNPPYSHPPVMKRVTYFGKPPERGLVPSPDAKLVSNETIEVSGVAFECDVYEEIDDRTGVRHIWYAKKYPFRIRVDDSDGQTIELLEEIKDPGKAGDAKPADASHKPS